MFANKNGKEKLLIALESNDNELKIAIFDTFAMTSEDIERLANGIKNNTFLDRISMLDCNLQPGDIAKIANAMMQNTSITHILIEEFEDDSEETKKLIKAIYNKAIENKKNKHDREQINPHF